MLLTGRALQEWARHCCSPTALHCSTVAYQGAGRGRAVGTWAAAGAISAAGAPLLGGWLVGRFGWSTIFCINLPLVAGAIVIALLKVAEVRDKKAGPVDYPGAILATVALGALTYGLTRWSSSHRFDAAAIAGTLVGALLMIAFVVVEDRRGAARDDANHLVRHPGVRRPEPDDVPSLRRVRRSDARHSLCPDRGRALLARCGWCSATAAADPDRRRLARHGVGWRSVPARACH